MEPNTYENNVVKFYASHDSHAEHDVIESMASIPASKKLQDMGISLVMGEDGKLRAVSSRYAKSVRSYLERSGVLENALSKGTTTMKVDSPVTAVEAQAQVAER